MQLTEPVTFLTDGLLGALTLALAVPLLRSRGAPAKLWGAAFLATGLGALTGGTFHGFAAVLSPPLLFALWKITVYCIGIAAVLLLAGAILATTAGVARRLLLAAALLKFLVYATWVVRHDDFRHVVYDYAPSMILIFVLFAVTYRSHPLAARWILGGIAISFAAAAVQWSGFAIHRHFNHNDLYHVIQMIAMFALQRGGVLLEERRSV